MKAASRAAQRPENWPLAAVAQKEYDKLVAEKTKKGYVEK
ncbi:MAG: WGR domain-containing protein [Myxococcales bacterium]|nr:WGR domain-containing protein [Myxococcales bacterium]